MPYDLFFPPKSITASSLQGEVGMVCAIDISSLPNYARNPVPVETLELCPQSQGSQSSSRSHHLRSSATLDASPVDRSNRLLLEAVPPAHAAD